MAVNRTRRNIVANLGASFYSLLLSVGAIPIYLHLIGIEAMGLITFHVTLSAIIAIVQAGLSAAVGREVARLDHEAESRPKLRGLLRAVQPAYWGLSAAVALGLGLLSDLLASSWLHASQLDPAAIRLSLLLLSVQVGVQLQMGLYLSVLDGLQHQALRAALNTANMSLSVFGVIALLTWGPRSVVSYFAWTLACAVVYLGVLAYAVQRLLPAAAQTAERHRFFAEQRGYIVGAVGIAATTILLLQVEKLVLSGAVTLDQLGYYGMASTLALALYRVVQPVNTALLPRINVLTQEGRQTGLDALYLRGLRIAAFLLLPATALLVINPDIVLLGWTQSAAVAASSGPVLRLLALGATVHVLSELASMVQICSGRLRYCMAVNTISLLVVAVGSYLAAARLGIHAAAAVWAAVLVINGLLKILRTQHQLSAINPNYRAGLGHLGLMLAVAVGAQLLGGLLVAGSGPLVALAGVVGCAAFAYLVSLPLLPEAKQLLSAWRARRAPLAS